MEHNEGCMCDACINARIRKRLDDQRKAAEAQQLERTSQDYIRRRGGVDPRSPKDQS